MLITSRENPIIKETCLLISDKKTRMETGMFAVEGARLVSEAAKSNAEIVRLFITEEAGIKYEKYLKDVISVSPEVYTITENIATKMSDTKSPQGVFAVFKIPELKPDFSKSGLYVMLSGLQDPGNIGTILRTCDAMDVKGVILSECTDIYSPKVLRSSMGCLFRLPVSVFDTSECAVDALKKNGITSYASALRNDAKLLGEIKFDSKSCILIGNEGNGLREEIIDKCDVTVMIPMKGRAESLNAASAAAILIYSAAENI